MRLTVLGSGTVAPHPHRTAPAHWVEAGPIRILVDCGPGVCHRLAEHVPEWPTVTHIALSHFHVDHWGELPLLLFAMKWGTEPARTAPLTLMGPAGLRERLSALDRAYGESTMQPGYPIAVTEVAAGASLALADGVSLETYPTPHTEESLALAVRQDDVRLVYTGDTGPSEDLARWAHGCDLLLAECSLPDDRAIDMHLTPSRVAAMAQIAQPRHVVLTHLYPPVEDPDPAALVRRLYDGPVTMAGDGMVFEIGDPSPGSGGRNTG